MADVIERLRASKEQADASRYQAGETAGKAWAESAAEAEQLERLQAFRERCEDGRYTFEDYFEMETRAPLGHAGWIAAAILADEDDQDTNEARAYAEDLFGVNPAAAYVRGFVDGALKVWGGARPRL